MINLSTSLKGTPSTADESGLPNGVSILDLALVNPGSAQTGLMVRDVSSSGSMLALEGPGGTVAEASLLVFRASAPVEVELTQKGKALQVVYVKRLLIVEFDDLFPLVLLRVQGVAKLEYFANGLK